MEQIEAINQIFPEPDYIVKKQTEGSYDIETADDFCFSIKIGENNIYISTLSKCNISGTEILNKIEKLAKLIPGITKINLTDGSVIMKKCGTKTYMLSLAYIKLLTKGKSWYNSLGYISDDYENEEKQISEIINMPAEEFFEKIGKPEIIPFDELTVQQYFIKLLKPEYNTPEMCTQISSILRTIIFSGILKYDNQLTKHIQHGGGKSRKQRKSKKSKKSRKNKNILKYKWMMRKRNL